MWPSHLDDLVDEGVTDMVWFLADRFQECWDDAGDGARDHRQTVGIISSKQTRANKGEDGHYMMQQVLLE